MAIEAEAPLRDSGMERTVTNRNPVMSEEGSPNIGELSAESYSRIVAFVTRELGIKMPDSKITMVKSRLGRLARQLGFDSLDRYAEYAFADNEEREHMVNALTTNKTDFFREPEHFAFLANEILPSMSSRIAHSRRSFKVWSAGCSSGEEPFTLAMVLAEYAMLQPGFEFAILGTDVSTRVLNVARAGVYAESQVQPVPQHLRAKYLLRHRNRAEGRVRVVSELRERVTFHQLNFMETDYPVLDTFDVIFFRNVMIYFDRAIQESVINKLCPHLRRGGYFIVGHSESLFGLDVPLTAVRASIYRKRER